MDTPPLELVYKTSERAGIRRFEPRPFWVLDDFARSGSAADPAKVPPGARIVQGVYATRASFTPFYFPPRHCPRFSIEPWVNDAARPVLENALGPLPPDPGRLIVFSASDRNDLQLHEFSVYAFDVAAFERLPTREYFARQALTPLREERRRDAVEAAEAAGWVVRFVSGIEALRDLRGALQTAGVTRFSAEKM